MALALHLINSFAMMGAIALIYGGVQRLGWSRPARHVLLGLAFGFGASVQMMQSLTLAPGIIVDSRALFIGFAGAFLGPLGAMVALVSSAILRISFVSTASPVIAIVSMCVAALMGSLWPPVRSWLGLGDLGGLVLLAAMISLPLVVLAWLPVDPEHSRLMIGMILVLLNLAGALVFGTLLQRERSAAQRERALVAETQTDALTGVLNRRSFERRFADADGLAGSRGTGLMIVDIDHFKRVNDVHGHEAGDIVLRAAATRLRNAVRPGDSVIRLGGEEFAVLLPDVDAQEAERAAHRLQRMLTMNCRIDEARRVDITVSIGVTHLPPASAALPEASRMADGALYRAKSDGRARVVFCPCT
ncbi:diguanylate cyclase [Cereibacter azotoformans]|uniref:GGDEF domain-containing protein n=1 Tax=Cereibacter azotoformans TaxID=43057 RepID=UPI003B211AD9